MQNVWVGFTPIHIDTILPNKAPHHMTSLCYDCLARDHLMYHLEAAKQHIVVPILLYTIRIHMLALMPIEFLA